MSKPRYALLSVTDKTNLVGFAGNLKRAGFTLISTGGTAKELRTAGFEVIDVAEFTGVPEMLDGRVKTLNAKIFAGILMKPTEADVAQLKELKLDWPEIELVVVNLYDFEATTLALEDRTELDASEKMDLATEKIDIGGPSLLRAAAKNWHRVTVVCDPDDYPRVAKDIDDNGKASDELRLELATKVFDHTSAYDRSIHEYLQIHFFPQT